MRILGRMWPDYRLPDEDKHNTEGPSTLYPTKEQALMVPYIVKDSLLLGNPQSSVADPGLKGILSFSVESPEEFKSAIQNSYDSKAAILGQIAEMFDPGWFWEPVKVQCKLVFPMAQRY
jgi:hypothetical protein